MPDRRVNASLVLYRTDEAVYARAIRSFFDSPAGASLVVVENSTSDASFERIRRAFPGPAAERRIRFLHLPANPGYGAAHNMAFAQLADGAPYHLILNPDVWFGPQVLSTLADRLDADGRIDLAMPRVLGPDGALQRLCKLLPTPADLLLRRFAPWLGDGRSARRYELRDWAYDREADIPSLSGCFMFLRARAFRAAGMFDRRFFMYAEDVDLSRRLHARGRTVYVPAATIVHAHERASYKSARMLLIHARSVVSYFNKWGWAFDRDRTRINKQTIESIENRGAARGGEIHGQP